MEVLLRQLHQARDGSVEYQDTELSADVVSIGSAADCTVQLLGPDVRPRHAQLRRSGGVLQISCASAARVLINGLSSAGGDLAVGDVIGIGGHRLTLLQAPAGFDAALELEYDATVSASAYEKAFRTDLEETWLSRRAAAWILAVLVLALGLIVPYSSIAPQRSGHAPASWLPSDHFWTAGPLSPPHELAAGQRCSACHQQIFLHVRDAACKDCHKSIADHVGREQLARTLLGPAQRCAQCHREHHGPDAGLIVRDDGLCIDCHARAGKDFGSLKVEPVTGFSRSAHPAFTVALLKPVGGAAADTLEWQTRREPIGSAHEQSNLKFSHAQHLDPAKVTRQEDGAALGCGDCHKAEPDGQHFVPISMQHSCAGCHELTFDPQAPDRQLPHGRPRDAVLLIQDYFVRAAVDPRPAEPTIQRRRLPDQMVQPQDQFSCSGPALPCAQRHAEFEIENQFNRRGCVSCHEVKDTHAASLLDRYRVIPVRLTRDYFPEVHFSHRLHAVQKDKSGDAACLACHAVRNSRNSSDVFIPDLPKCLECHSERRQVDRVQLRCAGCHSYHPVEIMTTTREASVQ